MQGLGEDIFPEPEPAKPEAAAASSDQAKVVEDQKLPSNAPSESKDMKEAEASIESSTKPQEKVVTTEERKPLKMPESVHIKTTPEILVHLCHARYASSSQDLDQSPLALRVHSQFESTG